MPSADHDVWDQLMPHTITVERANTTRNSDGSISGYQSPVRYRCLITDTSSVLRTANEDDVNVATVAYVNTDGTRIGLEDRITFPSGFGPTPPVVRVVHNADEDGAVHNVQIFFG